MESSSQSIKLSFPFTLSDRIRAAFALMPQRTLSIVLALIWPLIGILFLAFMLAKDRPLGTDVWVVVVGCLFFYPLIVVIGVTATYFSNKHAREPFVYSFDDAGIHVSAASYEYTNRWPSIARVKKFGGFLMFFFAPGCAHCIPAKHVRSAGAWEALVAMAKSHGANVDGT